MLGNIQIVAQQVGILFLLIFVGYICCKRGIFSGKSVKQTTDLLFYVITPCVIIKAFQMEFDRRLAGGLLLAFVCAVASHLLSILISSFFFKNKDDRQRSVLRFGVIYSNCGFMALPLAQAVLGDEGVFYCSAYVAIFNLFAYTQGVRMMKRSDGQKMPVWKTMINPGTVGIVVGLPFFLFSTPMPDIIYQPVKYLAEMNTPLAMIIIGTYLARTHLPSMIKEKTVYISGLLRLVVIPLLMFGLFYVFNIRGVLLSAMMISVCAPPAATTIMFAAKFDNDADLASKQVSLLTLLSIITMPILVALANVVA